MCIRDRFYIIIRLRKEKETDVFPYLSRIEQSINDNGFTTRRAAEQDLKRMLGVYFEQNVTTEPVSYTHLISSARLSFFGSSFPRSRARRRIPRQAFLVK